MRGGGEEQEEDEKMDGKTGRVGSAMRCDAMRVPDECGSLPSENSRSFQSHRHRQGSATHRVAETHNSGIEIRFRRSSGWPQPLLCLRRARAIGQAARTPTHMRIAGNFAARCTRVLVARSCVIRVCVRAAIPKFTPKARVCACAAAAWPRHQLWPLFCLFLGRGRTRKPRSADRADRGELWPALVCVALAFATSPRCAALECSALGCQRGRLSRQFNF